MYILAACVVIFVIVQSIFFFVKAWKQGKKLGISTETMKKAVTSSAFFTIAPSISIVATVLTLSSALGLVLPWIRLSVIGNMGYELTAAEAALDAIGAAGISQKVTDPKVFTTIAWVMTVGSIFPLVIMPFVLKKLQSKIGKAVSTNAKWADTMSAATFIGLISAFIARAIIGSGDANVIGDGAGVLSVIALIFSIIFMLVLTKLCTKFNLTKLEPFAMPASMIGAMGVVMAFAHFLPDNIAFFEWRG